MKSKTFKAVSILLCLFMILSIFAACSPKNPSGDNDGTLSPDESWFGGDSVYEPVTISSVELADLVNEALGSDAKDFNGDLNKLTPDQLQKVEEAAKDKGYTIETDSSGNTVIKKEDIPVTKVSQDEVNEIMSKASIKDVSNISKDDYIKISQVAGDNGMTAVTNNQGGVDIVKPQPRPTNPVQNPTQNNGNDPKPTQNNGGSPETTKKNDPVVTTKKNTGILPPNQPVSFTQKQTIFAGTTLVQTNSVNEGFKQIFSGSSTDAFRANALTSDGGIVTVGISYLNASGDGASGVSNGIIVKYDKNGNQKWQSVLAGNDLTTYEDVAVLKDGSIIAVGQTLATNITSDENYKCKGSLEGVVSKYSNKGEKLWTKAIGGSDGDIIYAVEATPDGGFVIGGKTKSTDLDFSGITKEPTTAFVFKLDANGNITNRFAIGGTYHCSFDGLAVASNGDIFGVCINANDDGGFAGIEGVKKAKRTTIVFKFSSTLKKVWTKTIYLTGSAEFPSVIASEDGGCVIAGQYSCSGVSPDGTFEGFYNGGNKGTTDAVVMRINSESKIMWILPLIGFENDVLTGIAKVPGGYAVTGYTTSTNRDFPIQNLGDKDAFVYVVSEYGKAQTIRSFAGSGADSPRAICSNGSTVYVCGQTSSKDGYFKGNTAEKSAAFLSEFKLSSK